MRTAGRTVLFSAVTVLLSLGALLVFPLYFLRSFAYAGISAVVFAAIGAIVVLPAALVVLGPRIDALDLSRAGAPAAAPARRRGRAPTARASGTASPSPSCAGRCRSPPSCSLLLVTAGLPFSQVVFGLPDDRVLPRDASGHVIAQTDPRRVPQQRAARPLRRGHRHRSGPGAGGRRRAWATRPPRCPASPRVDALTGTYVDGAQVAPAGPASARFAGDDGTYLTVVPGGQRLRPGGRGAGARRCAGSTRPFDDVVVGGQAASLVDTKARAGRRPAARARA